jgi:hypothetical protein
MRFDAGVIRLPLGSPDDARRELAARGYQTEDGDRLVATGSDLFRGHRHRPRELPYAVLAPISSEEDPRLMSDVRLSYPAGSPMSVPDALAQVAVSCQLAVVSHYLPPDAALVHPAEEGETRPLGDVLREIRRHRGGAFWWRFLGEYLVTGDANLRYIEAAAIAEELLADWAVKLSPGGSFSVDEIASLTASLNVAQLAAVMDRSEGLQNLPVYTLPLYGALSETQRAQLAGKAPLAFTNMSEDQRSQMIRFAQVSRPWTTPSDYRDATIRVIRRELSGGRPGVSVVVDYHFRDAPSDRDVLFTCPLQYTVGEDGYIN